MNKRIQELAKQAGLKWKAQLPHYTNTNNPIDFPVSANRDLEKFAELIVGECLSEVKGMMVDESELLYEHEETTECVNEALMDAHHNIAIHFGFAKHFGVEE